MSKHHFTRFLSLPVRLALAALILGALAIGSGQASAQQLSSAQLAAVNNLKAASGALAGRVQMGVVTANQMSHSAGSGAILDPGTYLAATITQQQVTSYNAALTTYKSTSFFDANQFLLSKAEASKSLMQGAIADLSAAAVDLQSAAAVSALVATVGDAPAGRAAQLAITSTGLDAQVTGQQVAAFNNSLQMVNAYATQTGAFFAAANKQSLTSSIDLTASNYNASLYTATAAYNYGADSLSVAFDAQLSASFSGLLKDQQVSVETFFSGPAFYGAK